MKERGKRGGDKDRRLIIKNKKLRGEWVEQLFVVAAYEHGLPICGPWGEMRGYDFVVGWPGYFVAVQVKSTTTDCYGGYACNIRQGHEVYAAGSFDFLAAYVVFEKAWYIVPAELVAGKYCITLFPESEKAKWEEYREAWYLLDGRKAGETIDLMGCAEEFEEGTRGAVGEFAEAFTELVQVWGRVRSEDLMGL
ncbi:MAG TPA: group I intron-associated PD-(D/E)XK endonuclease [Candidatus Sulfotelmatobacter sp.]|jgi:hypothetical protein|nr:group I intron-associated PD-(D/E)XK endonuclease [Candidatus Sulfotelmatobacter sp.]